MVSSSSTSTSRFVDVALSSTRPSPPAPHRFRLSPDDVPFRDRSLKAPVLLRGRSWPSSLPPFLYLTPSSFLFSHDLSSCLHASPGPFMSPHLSCRVIEQDDLPSTHLHVSTAECKLTPQPKVAGQGNKIVDYTVTTCE